MDATGGDDDMFGITNPGTGEYPSHQTVVIDKQQGEEFGADDPQHEVTSILHY
jgi:hypothetical protein